MKNESAYFYSEIVSTPIKDIVVTLSASGVIHVSLDGYLPESTFVKIMESIDSLEYAKSNQNLDFKNIFKDTTTQLTQYFKGERKIFTVPLDWSLTNGFRMEILRALCSIPYSETISYQDLGGLIGHPRAARAVGTAMATNPLPLFVPCHRVIKSDGSLGQYGGGVEMKKWLLAHEKSL